MDEYLEVRVQPGAKRSEVAGLMEGVPRIRLRARPVEGAANAALVEFLAETLDLPRSAIEIVSGHASRRKRIRIRGMAPDAALKRLTPAQRT